MVTHHGHFGTLNPVENSQSGRQGPRPARQAAGSHLSRSRAALLQTLQRQAAPTSLAALVAMSGLHANTVREHVEGLRREGLVRRSPAPAVGRGRPGWLYEATSLSHDDPRPEYAGLAVALASVIARTSPQPAEDAREAGVAWGRRLVDERPRLSERDPDRARRRAVSDLFADMGFEPEPDRDVREVRLRSCPLLQAAHQQPEIVCAVHRGIAEGALASYGAPSEGVDLLPFVEPGACLLRLQARK